MVKVSYILIFLIIFFILLVGFSIKKEILPDENKILIEQYAQIYVQSNGAIISNPQPVGWCPNSCIGCDNDITSEAISRYALVSVNANDRVSFEKEVNYYLTIMQNPANHLMQWKLNGDGTSGTCGGENSAVDSELIFIGALIQAENQWGGNYIEIARPIMDSLKNSTVNYLLPYCIYHSGDKNYACENKVYLGYINLVTIQKMCLIDSWWCTSYQEHKKIMIDALQDNGVYSTYNIDTKKYSYENADIHPNWVIKHLAENPDTSSIVEDFYHQSRNLFYNDDKKICQEFQPTVGCKISNAPLRVYATYLELAKIYNDNQFKKNLTEYIREKMVIDTPMDNYGNIVVLEALTR